MALWALAGALRQAGPQLPWAIPALGAGVALVHATAAHRIGGIPWAFSFLLAAGHVAAFGAWLGCVLVALAEERWKALARTAVLAAVFLSLGGAALAFGHLNGPADLVETAYGSTLLVKISLVAIAFSLGAAARRQGEPQPPSPPWRRLPSSHPCCRPSEMSALGAIGEGLIELGLEPAPDRSTTLGFGGERR